MSPSRTCLPPHVRETLPIPFGAIGLFHALAILDKPSWLPPIYHLPMQSAVMTMSRRGHPKEKVLMLRSQRRLAGGNCAESAGSPESRRSLHLNLVRGVGEANRNIEIVAILSCTLGLRLLMLCPESSSKRPALTRETMLSHGTPAAIPLFRSYSRSGRPRWSPPCRPAAVESWILDLPGGSVFLRLTPMAAVGS